MESNPTVQPNMGDLADSSAAAYDAILVVGFGGPERREDVLPFLENVTRGRNIPRDRLLEVATHYDHFGGASPINSQVRALIDALRVELDGRRFALPIFWGNRNWHPMLGDAVAAMASNGVKKALALVLAAYGSYSSCRQYLDDIARARAAVGPPAPLVDKLRLYYNHPDFVAANADRVHDALERFPAGSRDSVHLIFTAHSIPVAMARNCKYEHQLGETCRLVAEHAGIERGRYDLTYQSRSGRPGDPWLVPDILDRLRSLNREGVTRVLIHPIGFLSDHMEVLYDLDEEARALCAELGLTMVRGKTVGTHPRFVSMLGDLVAERLEQRVASRRQASGSDAASHDVCPAGCCLPPSRSAGPSV
jgi:protoporphyrin/coproporphyrin ferrochelatase